MNSSVYAQEKAYWQDIAYFNPAAIGTQSDWVYTGYNFSNHDKILTGYAAGADYQLSPKAGSFGVNLVHQSIEDFSRSVIQANYAYSIDVPKAGQLNFGISAGIVFDHDADNYFASGSYSYSGYQGYSAYGYNASPSSPGNSYDPGDYYEYGSDGRSNTFDDRYLRTGIGVFYNSKKYDVGLSYTRYDEIENEIVFDIFDPVNNVSFQAAYHFSLGNSIVLDPNVMLNFNEDDVNKYLGVFVESEIGIWAGYDNYNFGEVQSFMLGYDFKKKFRIGYSYDFSEKINNERIKIHEFLLAVKIR